MCNSIKPSSQRYDAAVEPYTAITHVVIVDLGGVFSDVPNESCLDHLHVPIDNGIVQIDMCKPSVTAFGGKGAGIRGHERQRTRVPFIMAIYISYRPCYLALDTLFLSICDA